MLIRRPSSKAFAGREKLTLTRLIEEGLALRQRQHQRPSTAAPLPLPVHQGRGGAGPCRGGPPQQSHPAGCRRWVDAGVTPDGNVLVAASRSDHPHHCCAMDWLEGALAAAARGDRRECLVTFDRDFGPLLPARQLVLLNP